MGGLLVYGLAILTIVLIGWAFYTLLVKNTRKQIIDILGGLMFISVWVAIYFVFTR